MTQGVRWGIYPTGHHDKNCPIDHTSTKESQMLNSILKRVIAGLIITVVTREVKDWSKGKNKK